MYFIAYAPGLQPTDHNPSMPSETFDAFGRIAAQQGLPAVLLNYQNYDMPIPSEGGRRLLEGVDGKLGIATLQDRYGKSGIWVGNSVGGHMMLEAAAQAEVKPSHIVLYGAVLGVQSKVVELAGMQGKPALGFLCNVIEGNGQFPVPVAGQKDKAVSIGRDFFEDERSVWVRGFNQKRLDKLRDDGMSVNSLSLFGSSHDKVASLRENLKGVGITIMAGENDPYCHSGDIAAFKRDVAPQATVVTMPGAHATTDERHSFFRDVIASAFRDVLTSVKPQRPAPAASKAPENNA